MSNTEDEELRRMSHQIRKENFAIEIELSQFPTTPTESLVSVTLNGKNWQTIRLTQEEAIQMIDALKKHFGI